MSTAQKLREAILRWKEGKEKRSLSKLSRLAKVHYSTVRRIVQGERNPSTDVALKLADIVMTMDERIQFAGELNPSLIKNMAKVAFKAEADMLEYLNDKTYTPIILLSSHSDGTNEDEVRHFFGNEMVYKFNELVDSGHLTRCGKNWKLDKDVGSVSRETARDMLSVFAQICPSANDDIPYSSVTHVGWESVDEKTLVALFHLVVTCSREAVKLINDKDNKGGILVFFGSLLNVLKREGV